MAEIDLATQILQPVYDAFGVVAGDVGALPQEVIDQYNKVKNDLGDVLGVGGDTAENMGIAIGGGIFNAFANGDPAAAVKGVYTALEMALTASGPIGAAAVAGIDAFQSMLTGIGGTAHGGQGACGDCATSGQLWAGGFDIGVGHEQTPLGPTLPNGQPDPRWLPWTNQATRGPVKQVQSDGTWIICADDVPTNLRPWSSKYARSKYTGAIDQVNNPAGTGHVVSCSGGVSGAFAWLPAIAPPNFGGKYPKGSFDAFLLSMTVELLEKYVNAAGPQPSYQFVPGGGATINLRTIVEGAMRGWHAMHQGPAIILNGPDRLRTRSTTWAGKTSTQWYVPTPDLVTSPGSVAAFYMLSDSSQQDTEPYAMNNGPLIPSLAALYAMKPKTPPSLKGIGPIGVKVPPPAWVRNPPPSPTSRVTVPAILGVAAVGAAAYGAMRRR